MNKLYYVEFLVSDGVTEEHRFQPVMASSETKALMYVRKNLEKEAIETGGTYKLLGIKYVED